MRLHGNFHRQDNRPPFCSSQTQKTERSAARSLSPVAASPVKWEIVAKTAMAEAAVLAANSRPTRTRRARLTTSPDAKIASFHKQRGCRRGHPPFVAWPGHATDIDICIQQAFRSARVRSVVAGRNCINHEGYQE